MPFRKEMLGREEMLDREEMLGREDTFYREVDPTLNGPQMYAQLAGLPPYIVDYLGSVEGVQAFLQVSCDLQRQQADDLENMAKADLLAGYGRAVRGFAGPRHTVKRRNNGMENTDEETRREREWARQVTAQLKHDAVKQVVIFHRDMRPQGADLVRFGSLAVADWLTERLATVSRERPDALARDLLSVPEQHWMERGCTQVVTFVDTALELEALEWAAREAGLPTFVTEIAGHPEIAGHTHKTVLTVGPVRSSLVDPITGHLPIA